MDLQARLLDPQQSVLLYGTTPPRVGTPDEAVLAAAEKLAARVRGLPIDGLIVYDIQDETGRTQQPRPFAFTGTVDPRRYAELLMPLAGRPAVTYKCIGELDEPAFYRGSPHLRCALSAAARARHPARRRAPGGVHRGWRGDRRASHPCAQ
jgi:hypothetical protein